MKRKAYSCVNDAMNGEIMVQLMEKNKYCNETYIYYYCKGQNKFGTDDHFDLLHLDGKPRSK